MPATVYDKVSWALAAAVLVAVLQLHLLPALLAGLLVFELVHLLAPRLAHRVPDHRAKLVAVLLLAVAVLLVVVAGVGLAFGFFHAGGVAAVAQKMSEPLENAWQWLPDWITGALPPDAAELQQAAAHWLREHAGQVGSYGKEAGVGIAHLLIGMVVGAMVALHEATATAPMGPLATALTARAQRFAEAFRRIVFAQVRISLINTAFTALYVLAVLPLAGVHLPLIKTMIVITFVAGLLPVVGNLISNAVIVLVSLAYAPLVALASLGFLVLIHKLEYFLNARIVGAQISARAWELLLAMLVMEAAFGLPGLVAAPVYYAYLKDELVSAGLV